MATTDETKHDNEYGSSLAHQVVLTFRNPAVVKAVANTVSQAIASELTTQVKELRTRVNTLEAVVEEKDCMIGELKEQITDLQQYSRRNAVRVYGVPENQLN